MTDYGPVETTLDVTIREVQGTATLTLVAPASPMEDVAQAYTGKLLGVGSLALSGQQIQLSVNGIVLATPTTGADGSYSTLLTFSKPGVVTMKAKWTGGSGLPPL